MKGRFAAWWSVCLTAAVLASCQDDISSPKTVASVTVAPSAPTVVVGTTVQLTATVRDESGNILTDRTVAWSSDDSAVASASSTGLVTGVTAGGPVTITATSEGMRGTAAITVAPVPVASVTVSPSAPTVVVGTTVQLTATVRDEAGNSLTDRTITWSSDDSAVASVSSIGLVTGVGTGGPVTITATSEGKSGTAAITVAPVPSDFILTDIHDPFDFIGHCPTTDPAYAAIEQDFEFLSDGQPSTTQITCTEPYTTTPEGELTDELVAVQTLRIAYYMNEGSQGKLPWTPLGLYDWMKSLIAGVNFRSQSGNSYCCNFINGKYYFGTSRKESSALSYYRELDGLFAWLGLFLHEVRHRSGPGHTTGCPAFPLPTDPAGCDAEYDLSNLGSYGVQYWFFAGVSLGRINIGLGCQDPATAEYWARRFAGLANVYPARFVANPPATVAPAPPYGGSCFTH